MATSLMYNLPCESNRPYGASRYEVWSPRLGRPLTLFGELNLKCWILIESNFKISRFCERPIRIKKGRKSTLVDFHYFDGFKNHLVFVTKEKPGIEIQSIANEFCSESRIELNCICGTELDSQAVYISNWSKIIRVISSRGELVPPDLLKKIEHLVLAHQAISLDELVNQVKEKEKEITTAATYLLLHRGRIRADSLTISPLNSKLVVEAAQ